MSGARSEATSERLLVIVMGGICEEQSEEQKILILNGREAVDCSFRCFAPRSASPSQSPQSSPSAC